MRHGLLAKRCDPLIDPGVDIDALVRHVDAGLTRLHATLHGLAIDRDSHKPPRGRNQRAEPVYLRNRCNNGCEACPNRDTWADDDESALLDRITRARTENRAIVLAGREPTIHPAFFRLIRHAHGNDRRPVGVVSNGRMFALPRFAATARRAGLVGASIKIFAPDAVSADAIARVDGGYEQAIQAFAALASAGIEGRELRAPLHARNLEHFADFAQLARSLGATQLRVEAALDAVTLDRLDAAAHALEQLAERCRVMRLPLEVSTLESGTGRCEWIPV